MAKLAPVIRQRFFDSNGAPLAAGKLWSYAAGTSSPKDTFSDQAGIVPNPNPLVLDGGGYGDVWLGSGAYKFKLTDAYDVEIWTRDNVEQAGDGSFLTLTVSGASSFAAASFSGQVTSTVGSGTAPFVVASTTAVANLNASLLLGGTWAIPGAIGATTPNTGAFTTLSASGAATVGGTLAVTGNVTQSANETRQTANGAQYIEGQISEEITLSTGGTTTDSAADLLPANAIIQHIVARVTATIATATDWKLGDSAQAARFHAVTTDLVLGTTKVAKEHLQPIVASNDLGPIQGAAAKLRVTTTGTPSAGKIRITVFYKQAVVPTS